MKVLTTFRAGMYDLILPRDRYKGESDLHWQQYQASLVEIPEEMYNRYLAYLKEIDYWNATIADLEDLSAQQVGEWAENNISFQRVEKERPWPRDFDGDERSAMVENDE